jgi:uncharacterized membrane protein
MLASPTARVAIAIVGLGAFLRAYNVGVPELWIDEYGTRWVLADLPLGETVSRVVHFHGQSPLYYLIARVSCGLFGVSAFSLRLPSLLFGIGVLAVAYPLGVRLFRQRHAALVALALFAVNERLIFYSQDARPYALALLCAMLSFLFYVDLLGTDTAARRVAYVLSTAGAFYAHYLFGLVAVVQLLHLTAMRGAAGCAAGTGG